MIQLLKLTAMENWIGKWKPGQSSLSGTQRVHCFLLPTFIPLLSSTIWLNSAIFTKTLAFNCIAFIWKRYLWFTSLWFFPQVTLGVTGSLSKQGAKLLRKLNRRGSPMLRLYLLQQKMKKNADFQHFVNRIDIFISTQS